ncbi:MAG: hypothetical protein H7Y88_09590 [Phycisphaerales bacterium]|nr:hypothetical protein [Phycisphaerales bacterium]
MGAAAGGAAGMAIGAIAGPIGAGIGAAVGAIAGGLVGKGTAEAVNPTVEDEYWRSSYSSRPYVESGTSYDTYKPAYQHGWESRARFNAGTTFDQAETDLRRDWETRNRDSGMSWDRAKDAVRDSWDRVTTSAKSDKSAKAGEACDRGMPGRDDSARGGNFGRS